MRKRDAGGAYDCILMDFVMPVMDGATSFTSRYLLPPW